MERRGFLRFSLLSAVTLVLKGRQRLFADPGPSDIRIQAPLRPWQKAEFSYTLGQQTYPGIAVRLPGKSDATRNEPGEIYAACRLCPHQACLFNYEMDYRKTGDVVGVTLENPVFFCRCHMSIFDPAQQGKVITGPANRPPWRFSIRLEKNEVIIDGIEEGVGQFG